MKKKQEKKNLSTGRQWCVHVEVIGEEKYVTFIYGKNVYGSCLKIVLMSYDGGVIN